MTTFRPQDLAALTRPPRTAAQVMADYNSGPRLSVSERMTELQVKLRIANPKALAADIDDAARALANMNLPSCLLDSYLGYRAKAVLQSYADYILASTRSERAA